MERHDLEELWRRKKAQTIRLMEVSDLTRQLAQAADRRDEVSVSMLLAMREDPIRRLEDMEASLREYLSRFSREDAIRAAELFEGAPPETPDEERLCDQLAQYRRLLQSVLEMDRHLSEKMGGQRSFYRTFRD